MNFILITLTCFANVYTTNALNILGIFPYEGKSHFTVFQVYLRDLARRGHNLTVISHFPETTPPPNYTDISLAGSIKTARGDEPFKRSYLTILKIGWYLTSSGIENCQAMLANEPVHDLVRRKQKFDVIVVEQFNSDCALGIAYKLGAPVVGVTSHTLMPYHYRRLGIPYNPAYVSFHFLDGGTKPTLYQRIERVVFDFYFRTQFSLITQRVDQRNLARYFEDIPPLEDLAREIKFLMVYTNSILFGSTIFPPNVIQVGGYHVPSAEPLSGDLKMFVEGATHGIIYISFGSVVKSSTMSEDQQRAILAALNKLPQRVIWKWENETINADKNNLYVSKWLPQVDILAHPKIVAFLSHAGMGGTAEAIHYGVPMIAMPILGDQPANAAAIEESGLGIKLPIDQLTKDNLLKAFEVVLKPEFRANVKQLSKAWHDRPMSPLDTAIFWTEFAARNANFTFRTAAADVPMYQYYNLDIVLVLSSLFAIMLLVTTKAFQIICDVPKLNMVKKEKTKKY